MKTTRCSTSLALLVLAAGCGGQMKLSLGNDDDAGSEGTFEMPDATDAGGLGLAITPSAPALCPGECVTLTASATGGIAPYTYEWAPGGAADAGAFRVCPTVTTTYTLAASDSSGAAGEIGQAAKRATKSVTVTVSPSCTDAAADEVCDSVAAAFAANAGNPTSAWSFGSSASVGSAFTRYGTYAGVSDAGAAGWGGVAQWFDPAAGGYSGPVPDVVFNPTASPQMPASGVGYVWTLAPGQFGMWPGEGNELESVTRWTAPAAGTFVVKSTFLGIDSPAATVDVHVLHDGAEIASGHLNELDGGNTYSFMQTVDAAAGDTIDFVVGPGADGLHLDDATALDARLCHP